MIQKKLLKSKFKKLLPKFKVIIDTNVWLSGILWGGVPGEILKTWRNNIELKDDNFTIVFSKEILKEIWEKLKEIARRADEDIYTLKEWLDIIEDQGEFVEPSEKVSVCRDEKDNKFLEAALASNADFLITGDKDLLVLKKYKKTKIITPRRFLEIYRVMDNIL